MRTTWRPLLLAPCLALVLGCSDDGAATDAAPDLRDAWLVDAGPADSAPGEAGPAELGPGESGIVDGPRLDQPIGDGAPDLAPPTPDLTPSDSAPAADTLDPNKDSDGDKLPDLFELASGLDPSKVDTDGDGTADGDEDDDKDGMSALVELAVWKSSPLEPRKASPRHRDLLVELDYQLGCGPSSAVLSKAIAAFDDVLLANPDGTSGITLHIYTDEKDLPVTPMAEPLADRMSYLGAHGPKAGAAGPAAAEMVHVMFVSTRPGMPSRGGDTVASSSEPPDKAGVLIYVDNLKAIFPVCTNPYPPAVSVEEALVSTTIHELGHTLQLGHDTTVGGAVNAYNVMSTDLGQCDLLKQRTRGVGNSNPDLGATAAVGSPRFSKAAALLMKLTNKLSVEANAFEQGSGYEM